MMENEKEERIGTQEKTEEEEEEKHEEGNNINVEK
jgi:hypothetical protein